MSQQESYCPHYERSTCLLHFPCCEHDTFFPCHKCHNERIGCTPDGCEIVVEDESMDRQVEGNEGQNERRNKHHPQAKCLDADTLRCTECLEVQPVGSSPAHFSLIFNSFFVLRDLSEISKGEGWKQEKGGSLK